jgi:dTDP-4-dehydrorhamnose 3,5-epimerase
MNVVKTKLDGVVIIEPDIHKDNRGWLYESWSEQQYSELGINAHFVQDNHLFSFQKGTLRGLHFQVMPYEQAKLVRCINGAAFDVAVDVRKKSSTFGQWIGIELSRTNCKQLFIPKGFAHGVLTLENNTEIEYKSDNFYKPSCERYICWNDPQISVEWNIELPILSEKDQRAPLIADLIAGGQL